MRSPTAKKNRPFVSAAFAAFALGAAALAACALTACDKSDAATAPVSDAKITMTKPVGGESFKVGDSLFVRWTVKYDPSDMVDAVDVSLSPDSGKTWVALPWGPNHLNGSIQPASAYWNNFAWKVTDSLYVATLDDSVNLAGNPKILVKVEQYSTADPLKMAISPKTISISL